MKYGGGRPPKNNWYDRHESIKPGDHIHVSYYYYKSHAYEYEQQPAEKNYLVLDKKTQYLHDEGVLWEVKELPSSTLSSFDPRSGQITFLPSNSTTGNSPSVRAHFETESSAGT